ncbi:MAG: SBBP repeat-containing protein, partial [Phaeodactylibacter sp.]|nr:SBBP repeat-containing protein [Phaeodactylibacter sp.]
MMRRPTFFPALPALCLAMANTLRASICYAKPSGTGDGLSWGNVFGGLCILFRPYLTSLILRSFLILLGSILYLNIAQSQTLEWAAHTPASFPIGADDYGEDIARDDLGNVYVTGRFEQTADFDPGPGAANLSSIGTRAIYVAKYDASGAYQWAFKIGANLSNDGFGIAVDGSGNVLVTGSFGGTADFDPGPGTANLTSMGGSDIFVAKYTSSGDYLWAFNMGGTSSDRGYALAVDDSDNVLVTGLFSGTVDFDTGPGTANLSGAGDIFVAKYDASGAYLWAINMGGTNTDESADIALDGSNNILITGYFIGTADFDPGVGTANLTAPGTGIGDIFVAKYSSSGAYQWAFSLGDASWDQGKGIAVDDSDNVLVTGYFQGTVDFDPGAGTANYTSAGFGDGFVAKYSPAGAYLWAFPLGGTSSDDGNGIAVDGSDNVVVTGRFGDTVDFDPGAGVADLSDAGNGDIFVAQYSNSGAYQWAISMGGASSDRGNGIVLDGSGNVLVTGTFRGAADFDPGPG